MKPPKCPICNHHHHLRDPHVFGEQSARPIKTDAEPRPTRPVIHTGDMANTSRVANELANSMANHMANEPRAPGRNRASSTYRFRNPDKRRPYQRDLMRQRRATGKVA